MNSLKKLKAVIFDLDGTLADTRLDFPAICREVGVKEGTPLLEYCTQLKDLEQARYIHSVIEKHEIQGAHQASWIGGAEAMLSHLNQKQIPMAIVTRNMRKAALVTINKLKIPITQLITREDCQPKPHPEGLLLIANDWNIDVKNIAYVGDYKFDLMAARNAGMQAFLIRNQRNSEFQYLADRVLEDFCQLTEHFS